MEEEKKEKEINKHLARHGPFASTGTANRWINYWLKNYIFGCSI